MFNLFKKLNPAKTETISTPISGIESAIPSYPKDVIQIHHEFNTAADSLIVEANVIISEAATKDVKKVSRLEALGFKQAGQVTELKPLIQKAELSKEQLELLAYYRREYPFNKFITEDQVKNICHKWNLVCGEVNRFKGFVPEKNLKEIENFVIKNNDSDVYLYAFGSQFYTESECIELGYWERNFDEYTSYKKDPQNTKSTRFQIKSSTLQICAPVKDMDIRGLELVEGYKLQKKHIPDPVVLQPVKGGYLILTAWGDEASDENVVNSINN